MRSQRACEILASEGFTQLTNMAGGLQGGPDASGNSYEPGWQTCGHPLVAQALPERTWSVLNPH